MSESEPTAHGRLALGLLCSVAAAAPAFVRVLPGNPAGWSAVALVGATSLVVVPLSLWLRRALSNGLPRPDRALIAGAALSALPLALFGGVLKSTTHHRPLGGATFAVAALCLLALCIGLSFRVFRGASGSAVNSTWQNLFSLGCGLSLVSTVALGLGRAARPSLVDFLVLLSAAAAAAVVPPPRWFSRLKPVWLLGGWVILLVCAVVSFQRPQLARSLTTDAPVASASLSWLGVGS